jgi:[protein-PII] uridylyltransferase
MKTVHDKRAIINRQSLGAKIRRAAEEDRTPEQMRAKVLGLLKGALDNGREEVSERFYDGATGAEANASNRYLIDRLVDVIYDFTTKRIYPLANPTAGELLGVIAVGGYGRGELAPHSDIDLLFLSSYKKTPHTEQVVEYMLYLLWDLGLKVGHATRSIDECIRLAKADLTIRTSVLESRHICGHEELFTTLRRRFIKEVMTGTEMIFVEEKLAERDARHQRMGDSRYVLEPNVKEGKGGLRDLHTLFWAREACATCTPCSGSPNISTGWTRSARWSSSACCRPRRPPASPRPRTSCGRCVATFTISPGAPRTG